MNRKKLFAIWFDQGRKSYQISDVSFYGHGVTIKPYAMQRMVQSMNVIMSIRASYFGKIEFRLWISPLISVYQNIEFDMIVDLDSSKSSIQSGNKPLRFERCGDHVVIYFDVMGDVCLLSVLYNDLLAVCKEIITNE